VYVCNVGVLCQTVGWITKMPLCMKIGLSPGDIVLGGDPALPRKRVQKPPTFAVYGRWGTAANVYCGQTARWITMPLGKEVDLGPRDIVLDGDPPSPRKGSHGHISHPLFGACLLYSQTVAHLSKQLLSSYSTLSTVPARYRRKNRQTERI